MRTREEIEESKRHRYEHSARGYEATTSIATELSLEVLLDIRDLLQNPLMHMTDGGSLKPVPAKGGRV